MEPEMGKWASLISVYLLGVQQSQKKMAEMANYKPISVTIYASVVIGILVSAFCIFSAVYTSAPSRNLSYENSIDLQFKHYSSILCFSSGSSVSNQLPNSSQLSVSNITQGPTSWTGRKLVTPVWELPSSGSKMPPLETFRLSRKLVKQRVKGNVIIVTFGNYAFMDFILTWVKHLTDLGLDNLIIGAMDTKLLEALYWKGVPVFDMSTGYVEWGSQALHNMGREKVFLINALLPYGFEMLMCDTDMVWLKDPLPYLARFPEADILTSSDQVTPTVVDDSLEWWDKVSAAYNTGIFHWRPTNSTKKFAREWKELLLADDSIWDQDGFNDLMRGQLGPAVGGDSGLAYAYDGHLKLGVLPASIFCSGHTYFVQAMFRQLRLKPYAVHTTFQYASTDGKRHRLREGMFFYDPPEYYDVSGGFVAFKPSIPKSLLLDGEHNLETHFRLVNYQIKQIRTALAVASLLNRTLVMPPLWCRLDRPWLGHLNGSMTRQPFLCPLDQVFEINAMLKQVPEDEFGPSIGIREYSLFDNPSMPQKVKESWLDVQLCNEGSHGCQSNDTTQSGVIKLPKLSSEETYKSVFSLYKDVKVIQFSSMQDAFRGFTDKTREEKFRRRMKTYTGIWCCLPDKTPGHIYYDIYWDEKPDGKSGHPILQKRTIQFPKSYKTQKLNPTRE